MKRNFDNFLDSYFEYADDAFCPPHFHRWIGRSILAAAVERKVSLKQGKIYHVPNLYVMLVSHPAVGKSTAMEAGTDLIERLRVDHNPNFRIIPNQTNEPAFIDLMKIVERYQVTPTAVLPQSAGYFYASEASSSALQNTCGDFVATLTAFYDCPKWFRKKLKGEQHTVEIENGCMNLLAGATFDYLKNLVNETSVLGGFASRLLYIVSPERKVRDGKWETSTELDVTTSRRLVEDLSVINQLVGPMRPTPGFIKRFEVWQPEFDKYLISLNSPRLEAIMSRKGTHLIKMSMIHSIAESNSLIVTEEHFDRALADVENATKDNPSIIASAAMADKMSQSGVNQVIGQTLKKSGGELPLSVLKSLVMGNGNNLEMVTKTLDYMQGANWIVVESGRVKLLVDPDRYL